MKIWITAISAVGLVVASVILFTGNPDRQAHYETSPETSVYQKANKIPEESASDIPENVELSVQTLDTTLDEAVSHAQPLSDSADEFDVDSIPEEIEMKVLEGQDYIGSGDGATSAALQTLQDTFNQDSEDGLVSFEAEGRFLDMVSNSERLSEYALAEASCKSSNCKVSFLVADEKQHTQLTNDFLLTMQENDEHLSVMVDPVDEEGYANYYLGLSDGSGGDP